MALKKCKLKQGDLVVVKAGKDKGKTGKIVEISRKNEKVLVEGINIVKKHKKSESAENKKAQIIEKEMPLHISNVMFYSSVSKKGERVKYQVKDNKKIRVTVKSKEEIK